MPGGTWNRQFHRPVPSQFRPDQLHPNPAVRVFIAGAGATLRSALGLLARLLDGLRPADTLLHQLQGSVGDASPEDRLARYTTTAGTLHSVAGVS
jgi:hypothetical protein